MPKTIERILLFISDFLAIQLAFVIWVLLRKYFGYFTDFPLNELFLISTIIYLYWFLIFFFFGLYRSWYAQSRFDEAITLGKTITFGVILIFLLTVDFSQDVYNPMPLSRALIASYWLALVLTVTSARMLLRTVQRKFLENGIGVRNTLIVGSGEKAKELYQRVLEYPALGYKVIGMVSLEEQPGEPSPGLKQLGQFSNLSSVMAEHNVEELLIALEEDEHQRVFEIIGSCNGHNVNLKIVPDLYDIIVGQARTNQIYGFPLIEILPELMPAWEMRVKKIMDIVVASIFLVLFLPVWIIVTIAIKLDSKGPLFYIQDRVGRDGKIFRIFKFRSMIPDAESITGPVWADKKDSRITRVGRLLRNLRIDEIPQLMNIIKGEMSLVGPRPERPYFVEKLKKEIPYYSRRLRVRPGITGWAQTKHIYDRSLDDVKKKLQFDLYYLENMSLRMDLKIILSTIYTVLSGKGQ